MTKCTILFHFPLGKLTAVIVLLFTTIQSMAWDTLPDENGKYDGFYDRPTSFPDFEQPASWPNAEYYVVRACLGKNGPHIENYEVAVYDQNNQLRHCNRSMAKDDHLCVLTIRGTEGDEFHCQIIYGDFVNPTIVDVEETFDFKTNALVGTQESPFILTCLPFAMTNSQLKTAFGDDVLLGDFVGYDYTEDENKDVVSIKVKFDAADAIEANHPYIIKVREDMTEFSVDNVDINVSDAPMVATCEHKNRQWSEFIGTYVQNTIVPEECLFLTNGKFYYSVGKTKMKAYRAYFSFYDVLADYENASEAPVYIYYPDDDSAGIVSIYDDRSVRAATWYTLDGRKLSVKPTTKGLYVFNGKIIAIK